MRSEWVRSGVLNIRRTEMEIKSEMSGSIGIQLRNITKDENVGNVGIKQEWLT